MDNLFVNLKKYRGNKKRTPHEEYFTQIITYLLKYDEYVARKFVKLICNKDITNNTCITPEYYVKSVGEFDIFIEKQNELVIVIENKMGAGVGLAGGSKTGCVLTGEVPIVKYIQWIKKQNHTHKYFILITHPYEKYVKDGNRIRDICGENNINFRHISWSKVYDFLKSLKTREHKSSVTSFLINQTIGYMEDENMDSWKPLGIGSKNELTHMWRTYIQFDKILTDLSSIFIGEGCEEKKGAKTEVYTEESISITRELKLKSGLELDYGFNVEDENLIFFIEVSGLEKMESDKLNQIQKEGIKIEINEDKEILTDFIYRLDEEFFKKDSEEQKKELGKFIGDVIEILEKIEK